MLFHVTAIDQEGDVDNDNQLNTNDGGSQVGSPLRHSVHEEDCVGQSNTKSIFLCNL